MNYEQSLFIISYILYMLYVIYILYVRCTHYTFVSSLREPIIMHSCIQVNSLEYLADISTSTTTHIATTTTTTITKAPPF
jgi:hypothetical protein